MSDLTTTLDQCPRCGGSHKNIPAQEFTNPPTLQPGSWWYFAICPSVGEPILLSLAALDDSLALAS